MEIRFLFLAGLIVATLPSSSLYGASELLRGLKIHACNVSTCLELTTGKARRSPLDSIYVFSAATVKVISVTHKGRVNKVTQAYQGKSGYFDPSSDMVVLKGISSPNGDEVVLRLEDQAQVSFYGLK